MWFNAILFRFRKTMGARVILCAFASFCSVGNLSHVRFWVILFGCVGICRVMVFDILWLFVILLDLMQCCGDFVKLWVILRDFVWFKKVSCDLMWFRLILLWYSVQHFVQWSFCVISISRDFIWISVLILRDFVVISLGSCVVLCGFVWYCVIFCDFVWILSGLVRFCWDISY